jgi:hypothetical protein
MASFLVRAFGLEAARSAGFADTAGGTHEANIDALAAGRVTAGCATGPLRYCPAKAVTRAQMATFLARATGLVEVPDTGGGEPAAGVVEDVFDPVTTPTVSDLDLDRLAVAVDTLDVTVDCPPVAAPESLDDVAEVVRIANGCMIVEYEPLRGRTVAEVREALSADLSVHAVGLPPRRIYLDQSQLALDLWQDHQWYLDEVNAEGLWDNWPTGADVIVAVIDTGVDGSNVDLKERVIDTGHICHRRVASGHGTHVAGIVAAERGNLGPVIGVAPEARILPIKVPFVNGTPLDPDCHNLVPTLTAAITMAVNEGADVINMSFRWPLEEDDEGQDTVELAVRAATMDDIIVVTSGGNCGSGNRDRLNANNCSQRHERKRPAVYPGVISVAATGEDRLRAPYSTSNQDVDIAAPGGVRRWIESGRPELMLSTWPTMISCKDRFDHQPVNTCWTEGTSMAAPVVSGVVAHLKAHHPDASVAEVQYALYSTASRTNDPSNASYRSDYGHGVINPMGAVRALQGLKRRVGDFVDVSSGHRHTCGLGANGVVECWGDNTDGQAYAPSGIFTAVSAGGSHSCAIREDIGTVQCWGNNTEGQTNAPLVTRAVRGKGDYFTAVSAGGFHSCGIRYSGTVECWGSNDEGQSNAPEGEFTEISAGDSHTCGLMKPTGSSQGSGTTLGGTVQCWGENDEGKVNAPGGDFVAVSAGGSHSCGIRARDAGPRGGGAVECWGDNDSGQTDAPRGVFTSVSAGRFHTCGIATKFIQCWGDQSYNQTGAPAGEFTTVAAGRFHSCGITDTEDATDEYDGNVYDVESLGTIQCWGLNSDGQTDLSTPIILKTYSAVEVGDNYSCGLRTGGTVVCWGLNNAGQASPPADTEFTAISAGQLFTCGLRQFWPLAVGSPAQFIQCWGRGNSPPGGDFRALTVDDNHGCAIKTDGLAVCWVIRDSGITAPVEAPAGVRFADIAASAIHSCGLTAGEPDQRTVECWGDDEPANKFSGGGQVSDRPLDRGFLEVAADSEYVCAIRTDRTIICWGGDDIRGRATGRTMPPPLVEFLDVAPGHQHACGIRADSSIACWGRDTDKVVSDAPTSGTFTDISSGDFHSCALRDNGAIECWGRNNHGQTDVP